MMCLATLLFSMFLVCVAVGCVFIWLTTDYAALERKRRQHLREVFSEQKELLHGRAADGPGGAVGGEPLDEHYTDAESDQDEASDDIEAGPHTQVQKSKNRVQRSAKKRRRSSFEKQQVARLLEQVSLARRALSAGHLDSRKDESASTEKDSQAIHSFRKSCSEGALTELKSCISVADFETVKSFPVGSEHGVCGGSVAGASVRLSEPTSCLTTENLDDNEDGLPRLRRARSKSYSFESNPVTISTFYPEGKGPQRLVYFE